MSRPFQPSTCVFLSVQSLFNQAQEAAVVTAGIRLAGAFRCLKDTFFFYFQRAKFRLEAGSGFVSPDKCELVNDASLIWLRSSATVPNFLTE